LEGKADVDEGGNGLDALVVLGMVQKISLAALVCWVPFEDVKLRGARRSGRPRLARRSAPAGTERAFSGMECWVSSRKMRGEAVMV
jgi:hypothetical protein